MNKSLITNFIAVLIFSIGFYVDNETLYFIGLFALSGAVTNWLAVHMLFEKIPGLYGSGIIPARFEDFKKGIKSMMMEQFFSASNLTTFLSSHHTNSETDLEPLIDKVDFSPTFDGLIEVVKGSSFGAMLDMVGGTSALEPMRDPFVIKIKQSIIDETKSAKFKSLLDTELQKTMSVEVIIEKIENILDNRLNELTPTLVKEIIQAMIKKHLGWLVVWGGVFGGIIGGVTALLSTW